MEATSEVQNGIIGGAIKDPMYILGYRRDKTGEVDASVHINIVMVGSSIIGSDILDPSVDPLRAMKQRGPTKVWIPPESRTCPVASRSRRYRGEHLVPQLSAPSPSRDKEYPEKWGW